MNADFLIAGVSALYSLTGVVRIVSYAAQFHILWKDNTGAQSTSLVTWAGFFVVWFIGGVYGWFVIHDTPAVFVSVCGALGSGMIFGLAAWRRVTYRTDSHLVFQSGEVAHSSFEHSHTGT